MNIEGLEYNTELEAVKLKAYGRSIQMMVQKAMELPTKEERQMAAETIIDIMSRVVPSQQRKKDRLPTLWYHLALLSDFKLDVDYPCEVERDNKLQQKPDPVEYFTRKKTGVRHYGRLIHSFLETLKTMEPSEERDALITMTANQMKRSLAVYGNGSYSDERVASDLYRLTDGAVNVSGDELNLEEVDDSLLDEDSMRINKKNKKK